MSKEPKSARTAPATPPPAPPEPQADPAILLGAAGVRPDGPPPQIAIARSDGADVVDLTVLSEQRRMLQELFNVALGRDPDSTRSLIDQTLATPKVTKVREAAQRMAEQLSARGFEIVQRS